jgi:hypothetical protein
MLGVSVDLGSIKLAGKNRLSLTLSSSLAISLPPSWSAPPAAEDLFKAFLAGSLWVSKAGSCQIKFFTLINGELLESATFSPALIATIASLASECSVGCVFQNRLRMANSLGMERPRA